MDSQRIDFTNIRDLHPTNNASNKKTYRNSANRPISLTRQSLEGQSFVLAQSKKIATTQAAAATVTSTGTRNSVKGRTLSDEDGGGVGTVSSTSQFDPGIIQYILFNHYSHISFFIESKIPNSTRMMYDNIHYTAFTPYTTPILHKYYTYTIQCTYTIFIL